MIEGLFQPMHLLISFSSDESCWAVALITWSVAEQQPASLKDHDRTKP
jgi:hypothetical protein